MDPKGDSELKQEYLPQQHLQQDPQARFDYSNSVDQGNPLPQASYHYFGYPFPEFVDYGASSASFFAPGASYAALPYSNLGQITGINGDIAGQPIQILTQEHIQSEFSGNSSSASSPSTPGEKSEQNFYSISKTEQQLVSTAFAQNNAALAFIQRSPFETFCTVPGRTSLLSSTTKYKVTVGEIQRRISPPECLNASLLGGILRKAKSKDGGKALRESLKRIGLALPAGRRKSANVTAWTALVEEEAVHMAKDFHGSCERDFPAKEIAIFLSRNVATEEDAHRRRTMLHYVRLFIKELSDLMNSDRSPICGNRPEVILDPSIQKPLTHFSMVTHGFGGLALVAVLDALNSTVHESFKHLDRVFAPQPVSQGFIPGSSGQVNHHAIQQQSSTGMMFSDSEPTLTPTRRTQHDPFSSGDEYLFGPRETTESFSAPVVVEAGITPHPKKRSNIVSSLRAPKIDLSGILKKTDFEDFIHNLEKETCLFGTVHVKAAAAVITVIDLIIVILMDDYFYKRKAPDVEYNSTFIVTSSLLVAVFLAQLGLRYKKSWMLIPLILIHTSFAIVVSLVIGAHIVEKFFAFKTHPGRLLILFMERWLITLICFYLVSVLVRTFMYIKRSTTVLPLTVVNALFDKVLKDEDVTLYEKSKKFATPVSEKPRTVRFVEPKDE